MVKLVLACCVLLAARDVHADEFGVERIKTLTVEGMAAMGTGQAAARTTATNDALHRAVAQTAGVHIQSMLTQERFSQYRDHAEQFGQTVTDKMTQEASGFIEGYNVVSEGAEGNAYKVKIEVKIKDAELARKMSVEAMAMAGARFPKLMFVVHEDYTGKDGKKADIEQSTLQPLLEDALLAQGFDLVAKDQIEKMRAEEKEVFSSVLTDDNAAAKVAMRFGAEYIVRAQASVKYTSFDDLGLKEFHGFTDVSLSAVNASSGAMVASKKESGSSPPNCYSEAELQTKAVAQLGIPLLQNLMDRVLQSWSNDSKKGSRYAVKVIGMQSYKKEALPFLHLVEKVQGVKQVNQVSFGDGRLELEVFYDSTADASKLQEGILTATGDQKAFDSLDARLARGHEINFEMK